MLGFIKDKLFDGAWEIIKEEKNRGKLRENLKEQLNREKKAVESCTPEERFDFQGLGKCLLSKLTDEDNLKKFAAIKKRKRDYIKKMIHKECLRDSKAKTKQAEERVRLITEKCFSMVDTFLQSGVSTEHSVLGGQIVDNVNEHIDKAEKNMSQKIDDLGEKIDSQNASPAQPEKKEPTNDNDSYLKTFSELLFLEDDYEDENVVSLADMYISPSIQGKDIKASECIKKWYRARTKPCLLLYGNAGVGKSSLVAKILADANRKTDKAEFNFDKDKVMAVALRNHTDEIDNELTAKEILTKLFNCDSAEQLKDKLLILDGLDELCVLKHGFEGGIFLEKLSRLGYGYHVLVTSRESKSYFTEPRDEEGLRTEHLVWEERQINDWLELYKAQKPHKEEWCTKFQEQFSALKTDDKRREIFCVPIILYICGTSETDIEDHSSIGSIYYDAFTKILLRKHLRGQSNTDELKKADKEANMTAWQFTKELAYQMFLLDTLDLVDDNTSKGRHAVGFRNAQKRTKDILKEYGIKKPNLELKKELAVCLFARENEKGGITFAHKTVYEYFTAVKLYEDYFAEFDTDYFKCKDEDTVAKEVMESFIEAFRYDGIPDDIFSYLCKMNEEPFSTTLGYSMSTGLDYKKYEESFVYGMQKHIYALIGIKRAINEYLYFSDFKYDKEETNNSWKSKSIEAQTSTAFANFTLFLKGNSFTNKEKIPECMLIGNFIHGSLNEACFLGWNLELADLFCAELSGADFRKANLTGANLTCANLTDAYLTGANLTNTNLKSADLRNADLTYANLTDAYLTYANLRKANLSSADLTDADLTYANLRKVNLSSADLTDADLSSAELGGADLSVADLRGADLRDANLRGTDLIGADLRGANLTSANLIGTYLIDTNLKGVDLRGADLSSADLRGADLSDVVFKGALYCNDPEFKTIFPEGFDPKEHGMIEVDMDGIPVEDE